MRINSILTTYSILIVLWCVPPALHAEIWSYSCAEAMTSLSQAQRDVAQQHQRVHQSKLALTLFADGLESCRGNRRGFAGGKIHCVSHRSHGGVAIKEVIQAQRVLDDATRTFEHRLKELTQACMFRE